MEGIHNLHNEWCAIKNNSTKADVTFAKKNQSMVRKAGASFVVLCRQFMYKA